MMLLKDKIVLITRSRKQSPDEIVLLENNGANVIALPTIKAVPVENNLLIDNAVKNLKDFDYLIFSSRNSVKFFVAETNRLGTEIPESVKVICVGSKTHEYAIRNNIKVFLTPKDFSAAGIIKTLENEVIAGKKVLLPCSVIARDELSTGLKSMNALVSSIPVYNIKMPDENEIKDEMEQLKINKPDIFIFTSPSAFSNYLKLFTIKNPEEYFSGKIIAAIGNTTKNEILKRRHNVEIVPSEFTIEATVKEIINFHNPVKTV